MCQCQVFSFAKWPCPVLLKRDWDLRALDPFSSRVNAFGIGFQLVFILKEVALRPHVFFISFGVVMFSGIMNYHGMAWIKMEHALQAKDIDCQ
jgi:hypothetical protein